MEILFQFSWVLLPLGALGLSVFAEKVSEVVITTLLALTPLVAMVNQLLIYQHKGKNK